jgi:hypothetical protein
MPGQLVGYHGRVRSSTVQWAKLYHGRDLSSSSTSFPLTRHERIFGHGQTLDKP